MFSDKTFNAVNKVGDHFRNSPKTFVKENLLKTEKRGKLRKIVYLLIRLYFL